MNDQMNFYKVTYGDIEEFRLANSESDAIDQVCEDLNIDSDPGDGGSNGVSVAFAGHSDEWMELGFGEEQHIIEKLPSGNTFMLVRDDDAAAAGECAWWALLGSYDQNELNEYEANGGTASYAVEITVK